jgi:hypothetical protein
MGKYTFSKALMKPLRSYNDDLEYIAGLSVTQAIAGMVKNVNLYKSTYIERVIQSQV